MKKYITALFLLISSIAYSQPYNGGLQNFTSIVNSSVTTLAASGVFTGTSEDVSQYAEIRVEVFSDVASGTDGFSMQQSSNGTNWDIQDNYTIPAATGKVFGVGVAAKFFRLVYTNGATIQASFRLQTIYHKVRTKPSSQRPSDGRTNDNDMEENLAYMMNYDATTNTWGRVQRLAQGSTTAGQTANLILTATTTAAPTYTTATSNPISTTTAGAVRVDASATTQPVSGTVTANAGTNLNTSALALETGGNLTTIQTNTSNLNLALASTTTGQKGNLVLGAVTTAAPTYTTATSNAFSLNTSGGLRIEVAQINGVAPTVKAASTPAAASDPSLVVAISPNRTRTYSCSFVVAPAATATDVFQLIGSATTTVEITRVWISATQTTGGSADIFLAKRSTANTGGTSTASTNVPRVSTDAAATAVGSIYTANPTTTGTLVGNVSITSIPVPAAATNTVVPTFIDFGLYNKPITLIGVAQTFAINLNGVTVTGGSLKINVEFREF
jgi:hypothetical protein